jgi:hypothetical protein
MPIWYWVLLFGGLFSGAVALICTQPTPGTPPSTKRRWAVKWAKFIAVLFVVMGLHHPTIGFFQIHENPWLTILGWGIILSGGVILVLAAGEIDLSMRIIGWIFIGLGVWIFFVSPPVKQWVTRKVLPLATTTPGKSAPPPPTTTGSAKKATPAANTADDAAKLVNPGRIRYKKGSRQLEFLDDPPAGWKFGIMYFTKDGAHMEDTVKDKTYDVPTDAPSIGILIHEEADLRNKSGTFKWFQTDR